MKKLIITIFTIFLPLLASAYDAQIDGIYYNFNTSAKTAEVTYPMYNMDYYSGSVIIPSEVSYNDETYSVTSIGDYAFNNCSGLTFVTIPDGVTSIGYSAFYRCSELTSVVIPNSVTHIYWGTFSDSGITSVVLPEGLTEIGDLAFANTGLTSVSIPSSVRSVVYDSFSNTPMVNNASDGLLYADNWALGYKGEMPVNSAIEIKEGTVGIACGAFRNNNNLKSVVCPEGLLYINKSSFENCNNLISISLSNSIIEMGNGFSEFLADAGVFGNCSSLTKVDLPSSLTTIGYSLFYNCSSLYKITIPNSVKYIKSSAFNGCSSLVSITIPDGVISINSSTFKDCSSLNSIIIPNSVKEIESNAFENCSELLSIELPYDIAKIGDGAFLDCKKLKNINLGKINSIGFRTFRGCTSLNSIEIPDGVTTIGSEAFYGCTSLESMKIPITLKSVGRSQIGYAGYIGHSFYNCYNIKNVFIEDLKSWCEISFGGVDDNPASKAEHFYCKNEELSDLVFPNDMTTIYSESFKGCKWLRSITIHNNISIEEGAFQGCTGLYNITLPENLDIIKKETFKGCSSLVTITIPATVEYIYQEAFANCYSLKEVIALPTTPPFIYNNTFSNYEAFLKVPEDSKDKYMGDSPWSKFTTIQTITGEDLEKKKCEKPTISFENGQLTFSCATEDVTYRYNISGPNATGEGNNINLIPEITITVYAIKSGYEKSDIATLSLSASGSVTGPDLNNDNKIDAADVVKLVNIITGKE